MDKAQDKSRNHSPDHSRPGSTMRQRSDSDVKSLHTESQTRDRTDSLADKDESTAKSHEKIAGGADASGRSNIKTEATTNKTIGKAGAASQNEHAFLANTDSASVGVRSKYESEAREAAALFMRNLESSEKNDTNSLDEPKEKAPRSTSHSEGIKVHIDRLDAVLNATKRHQQFSLKKADPITSVKKVSEDFSEQMLKSNKRKADVQADPAAMKSAVPEKKLKMNEIFPDFPRDTLPFRRRGNMVRIPPEFWISKHVYFKDPTPDCVIGHGTYGTVRKAKHIWTQETVALKKLKFDRAKHGVSSAL